MNNGRKKLTITWFIENYSYCLHKNGEEFFSPEFTADGLEGTVWRIQLFPRGYKDQFKGHISLCLKRNSVDGGPEEYPLNYEMSVLKADGSTRACKEFQYTFKKGIGYGNGGFLKMEELLLSDCLPQDILTVRVTISRGEGPIKHIKQISARTRIGTKQILFLHVTESFSTFAHNQKNTVDIRSPSKKGLSLSSSLYFPDDSWFEGNIMMEITPSDVSQILSRCKLSLLDGSGKLIPCGEADNRFDATRKDIQRVPLSLPRQVIFKRKNEYLPDDKLTLLCECTFSTGVEYENIETTLHEIPIAALNEINNNDQDNSVYNVIEKPSTCPSGMDDLKEVFNDQFLTDVELKTKTKSFPAHKIVLCARSSVFKAMLTNDMKEKKTNCVEVDDLEDDVVQQLLVFLYSDQITNLHWESALKLYYAADKYAIERLKTMCASFLVENLTTSTATELLLVADTHSDSYLKKIVENFIFQHEAEIFGSDEWGNLIETNPVLVSKTMRLKYKR